MTTLYYALVIVCSVSVKFCDVEHATWAIQSEPEWDTSDECFAAAEDYVEAHDVIIDADDYRGKIVCEQTSVPA